MSNHEIGPDMQVTLHFSIKLEDDTLIDSTFEKAPAVFAVGDESLLPGFEDVLFGLQAGVSRIFEIKPEQGFGMPNPNNVQRIPRKQFAEDIELQEGLVVSFADANQSELPGTIASIGEEVVEVDFNHPLAGKNLVFEVKILDVQPV